MSKFGIKYTLDYMIKKIVKQYNNHGIETFIQEEHTDFIHLQIFRKNYQRSYYIYPFFDLIISFKVYKDLDNLHSEKRYIYFTNKSLRYGLNL